MGDWGVQVRQLMEAANMLMQRNAFPTEQELSRAINDVIGGSTDEECKQLAGGFSKWSSLRAEVRHRHAPTAPAAGFLCKHLHACQCYNLAALGCMMLRQNALA